MSLSFFNVSDSGSCSALPRWCSVLQVKAIHNALFSGTDSESSPRASQKSMPNSFTGTMAENALVSYVHSKALSEPHTTARSFVCVAAATSQIHTPHCMFMSSRFLDHSAETLLVGKEFLCKYLMTEVDFSFNSWGMNTVFFNLSFMLLYSYRGQVSKVIRRTIRRALLQPSVTDLFPSQVSTVTYYLREKAKPKLFFGNLQDTLWCQQKVVLRLSCETFQLKSREKKLTQTLVWVW